MTTGRFGDEVNTSGAWLEIEAEPLEGMLKVGMAHGHRVWSDEGTGMGGREMAPWPLDYLSLGLGF